ncbi:DUF1810 domain-containing protein [Sphingomonas sp. BIUV-7]|uniref:DUF1810 domain-containing protein n=1 Tax=Sphingomonas natans TaxID=3063330 RepID=A0ABT8Y958_9SPHN|nr:DUF1810 domain-containing protein [Sphingomonas sp. BIUV-7]MDO6414871.1 DUF1810 domain-containing protein [Sphingomonas sp. BIUV-7]
MASSGFDLDRFVTAQQDSYAAALTELKAGRKRSHWMWFVFPQIAGLGHSAMSRHYAIGSLAEARAYLAHPILGARLIECLAALEAGKQDDMVAIFGAIDATKLRSSLTLFGRAAPEMRVFQRALDRWFGGTADAMTLAIIEEVREIP